MGMILEHVVPWGRNIDEYKAMFALTDEDMKKKIAGFGDGPACFNRQAHEAGADVTSFDPVYEFSEEQLRQRIGEVRDIIMEQMSQNMENYVWDRIHDLKELENIRMSAMEMFLEDYEKGKAEGRYVCHELPERLPFEDGRFDIGLSSHFLLMYQLGLPFHIKAISEMLRVCKEVRIFPICDLDSNATALTEKVMEYFGREYKCETVRTDYMFQKGADRMLVIRRESVKA